MDVYWFVAGVCCGAMGTVIGKVVYHACHTHTNEAKMAVVVPQQTVNVFPTATVVG